MSGPITGTFAGGVAIHGMVGEFTLCGDAFDGGDSGDFPGRGSWLQHPDAQPVTCTACIDAIKAARAFRIDRNHRHTERTE